MAYNETWMIHDLMSAVKVEYLDGNVFSQDNAGNLIGVRLTRGGVDYDGGGTVSANVIRADGATVAVPGTLYAPYASVVLPQSAYAVPGIISIIIKLTVDGAVTTIGAMVANVYISSTDTVVDPGTIIPSIQTLVNQINTAVSSIPADYSALWTSLAPAYSTSSTYAVGQYVTYNGGLYRCTTAITSGESWTSAHWTEAKLANDVTDLKSAINANNNKDTIVKDAVIEGEAVNNFVYTAVWEQGGISGTTGQDSNNPTNLPNFIRTIGYFQCIGSEKTISITTPSSDYKTVLFYYGSDYSFIDKTGNISSNTSVTIPDNVVYIRITIYNASGITPSQIPSGYKLESTIVSFAKSTLIPQINETNTNLSISDKKQNRTRQAVSAGYAVENIVDISIWEQGGISSSTGQDSNNQDNMPYFIRTKGYLARYGTEKTIHITTPSSDYKTILFYYGADYSFIDHSANIATNTSVEMPDNAVYIRLSLYNANGITPTQIPSGYKAESIIGIKDYVITVGPSGKDYTSLRSAFEYAGQVKTANNKVTVYVYEGTYYINNYYTSTEWNDSEFVGLIVPDGISVIGIGNVDNIVISADSEELNGLVSTLNIANSVHLENITVQGTHLRYTIHDDFADASQIGGYEQKFIGCKFYGTAPEHGRVFGSGTKSGAKWYFENCDFVGTTNDCFPFAIHNNTDFIEPAYVKFNNCRFKATQQYIGHFTTMDSNGIYSNVEMFACTFDAGAGNTPTIRYRENGYSGCLYKSLYVACNEFDVLNQTTGANPPEVVIR